jgi:cytochrome bd ubiquinol oxidase subunit II
MAYQILWFILWGVLWAFYFMTDGFDLGAGILHPLLGKSDGEKRTIINSIGPVWDGNEVWLVTAGGVTFAAFPAVYASMFSYFYSALLIILLALILRGVAFEFRGKVNNDRWRVGWDWAIFLGSLIPSLLFGVAFGNIFQGLPMDQAGYHGSLLSLLNPYGLLTGLLFVLLFIVHGALWIAMKTLGALSARAVVMAKKSWLALLLVAILFFINTAFRTRLYDNYLAHAVWFVAPALAVAALFAIRAFLNKNNYFKAFVASCLTIAMVTLTGVIGLYPNLIPSSINPAYSLTAFNASSSIYTLKIMTVVVLIFVPMVITYQVWVYRIFRGKLVVEEVLKDPEAY